jgi:hypothetical protein
MSCMTSPLLGFAHQSAGGTLDCYLHLATSVICKGSWFPMLVSRLKCFMVSGEARAHCYWVQLYFLWYNLSLKFSHSTNLLKIWQKSLGSFAPNLSTPAPPLFMVVYVLCYLLSYALPKCELRFFPRCLSAFGLHYRSSVYLDSSSCSGLIRQH